MTIIEIASYIVVAVAILFILWVLFKGSVRLLLYLMSIPLQKSAEMEIYMGAGPRYLVLGLVPRDNNMVELEIVTSFGVRKTQLPARMVYKRLYKRGTDELINEN